MDTGTAEAWLITFTQQLRSQLPAGDYIITHAREYCKSTSTLGRSLTCVSRLAVAPWYALHSTSHF